MLITRAFRSNSISLPFTGRENTQDVVAFMREGERERKRERDTKTDRVVHVLDRGYILG